MKNLILVMLITLILGLVGCNQNEQATTEKEDIVVKKNIENEVDYKDSFNGVNGGAVFYNPSKDTYDFYNKDILNEQIAPYSTFKIITTLMGLSMDVVISPDSTLGYDGTIYSRDEWNKDVTLNEAFKTSCVWYYKKMMNSLDKEYVQEVLDNLEYGNCDLSAWDDNGHNGFWLSSSLKISPIEQIKVLSKIFEGKSNFDDEDVEMLKDFMLVEEKDDYSVYGKTGSARYQNSWFVGFVESKGDKTYFAVRLDDDSLELAGGKAKEIALDIVSKYYSN